MLTDRLGLPPSLRDLFAALTERWDGKGDPGRFRAMRSHSPCGSFTSPGTPPFNVYSAGILTRREWCRAAPAELSIRR